MTLIASVLFAAALATSIAAIVMTVQRAMPRITEIIEMEFAPVRQQERRIIFGEVKLSARGRSAEVVAFPARSIVVDREYALAA